MIREPPTQSCDEGQRNPYIYLSGSHFPKFYAAISLCQAISTRLPVLPLGPVNKVKKLTLVGHIFSKVAALNW